MPCTEHLDKRQLSCEQCYSNDELQGMISKLQEVRIPSSPATAKTRKKRLDEPKAPGKQSWRDNLFKSSIES